MNCFGSTGQLCNSEADAAWKSNIVFGNLEKRWSSDHQVWSGIHHLKADGLGCCCCSVTAVVELGQGWCFKRYFCYRCGGPVFDLHIIQRNPCSTKRRRGKVFESNIAWTWFEDSEIDVIHSCPFVAVGQWEQCVNRRPRSCPWSGSGSLVAGHQYLNLGSCVFCPFAKRKNRKLKKTEVKGWRDQPIFIVYSARSRNKAIDLHTIGSGISKYATSPYAITLYTGLWPTRRKTSCTGIEIKWKFWRNWSGKTPGAATGKSSKLVARNISKSGVGNLNIVFCRKGEPAYCNAGRSTRNGNSSCCHIKGGHRAVVCKFFKGNQSGSFCNGFREIEHQACTGVDACRIVRRAQGRDRWGSIVCTSTDGLYGKIINAQPVITTRCIKIRPTEIKSGPVSYVEACDGKIDGCCIPSNGSIQCPKRSCGDRPCEV